MTFQSRYGGDFSLTRVGKANTGTVRSKNSPVEKDSVSKLGLKKGLVISINDFTAGIRRFVKDHL